jgi:hypothetical protein
MFAWLNRQQIIVESSSCRLLIVTLLRWKIGR